MTEERPKPPFSGFVYGEIIYWGTIFGSIIAIIGSVFTFVSKKNYIDPGYLLSAIWQGQTVPEIWQGAVGSVPNGHWYLDHFFTGNGIAMSGLAFGVFIVGPAIFAASILLYKEKQRLYSVLAIIAGIITLISMFGLLG